MTGQAAGAAEVGGIPAIDLGCGEAIAVNRQSARMIDVSVGTGLQLIFKRCGAIGLFLQIGATDRGAIERIVNERLVEIFAKDIVLDIVDDRSRPSSLSSFAFHGPRPKKPPPRLMSLIEATG